VGESEGELEQGMGMLERYRRPSGGLKNHDGVGIGGRTWIPRIITITTFITVTKTTGAGTTAEYDEAGQEEKKKKKKKKNKKKKKKKTTIADCTHSIDTLVNGLKFAVRVNGEYEGEDGDEVNDKLLKRVEVGGFFIRRDGYGGGCGGGLAFTRYSYGTISINTAPPPPPPSPSLLPALFFLSPPHVHMRDSDPVWPVKSCAYLSFVVLGRY
jgi:hypothetical protein